MTKDQQSKPKEDYQHQMRIDIIRLWEDGKISSSELERVLNDF